MRTTEPAPALPEQVRARVVAFADATLAAMGQEEIPAPLRAVARFTPAKRARLAAPVLAAAVESHPDFRARVVDHVKDVAGELLVAVCAGMPPPAADPVDVAAVAYLARPEGYEQIVARAAESLRARAERSGLDEARDTIDRLKRDRDAAVAAADARVAAAQQGATAATAELAAAQKRIRALTGRLRAAERERDAAARQADEARQQAGAAETDAAAEVRRLRGRLEEATRLTDAARKTSRSARDVDDARLWLLLETVSGAVRGLRDELAITPTEYRPADDVVAAEEGARGRTFRPVDGATVDRLLTLPGVHLVVDGYNVTKTGYGELPLAVQRDRLVQGLGAVVARTGAEVTCVFDGAVAPPAQPRVPRGVRVLFSRVGEQADDVIRRLVAAEPVGRPVLVVSSDREVAAAANRPGGFAVPSDVLVRRLERG